MGKIVYKVVRKIGKQYVSAFASRDKQQYRAYRKAGLILTYPVGRTVRPSIRGTRLWAFRTYDQASQYASRFSDVVIFAALGGDPKGGGIIGYPDWSASKKVLRAATRIAQNWDWSSEALLCSSLKLIERVRGPVEL